MEDATNEAPTEAKPLGETCLTLLLAWLIPGLGHIVHRDWRRGLILFVVVQATFLTGMMLHGAVLWPAISPQDWGFNAQSILTFVVQIGNGLAALLCLGAAQLFPDWAAQIRSDAFFELGTIYLLVAGAANLFSVGGVYDRHLRSERPPSPRL